MLAHHHLLVGKALVEASIVDVGSIAVVSRCWREESGEVVWVCHGTIAIVLAAGIAMVHQRHHHWAARAGVMVPIRVARMAIVGLTAWLAKK